MLRVVSGSDAAVGRMNLPLIVQLVVLAIELQEGRGPHRINNLKFVIPNSFDVATGD